MTVQLKPGMMIRDNDPRVGDRTLLIQGVSPDYKQVHAAQCNVLGDPVGRTVKISTRRIYTDGKRRRSGFSLLEGGAVYDPQDMVIKDEVGKRVGEIRKLTVAELRTAIEKEAAKEVPGPHKYTSARMVSYQMGFASCMRAFEKAAEKIEKEE